MDQETQDKIIQHIAEYSPEFKRSMRRQYLLAYYRKAFHKQYLKSKKHLTDTVEKIWYYDEMRDKAIENGNLSSVVFLTGKIKELAGILVKAQNAAYFRRQNMGSDITNEMIRRAKDFPFESLVEFKNKMAFCPFHEDKKHPSMSLRANKVHCFSCNQTWDTIDFLIKKEGLTFPEAVKRLQ